MPPEQMATNQSSGNGRDMVTDEASWKLSEGSDRQKHLAVVLIGHGSRNPDSNLEFEALVAEVAKQAPANQSVFHGYIELASPSFDSVLESLSGEFSTIVVVPISLFMASHVKNDLPLAISRLKNKFPKTQYLVTPALGVEQEMVQLFQEKISPSLNEAADTALIIVGRGSSDPDANSNFFKMVRLIGEGVQCLNIFPCFIGITNPKLEETLVLVSRLRPKKVLVAPYFLFTGVLLDRIQDLVDDSKARFPWMKTDILPHIGCSSFLVRLIQRRIREVFSRGKSLDCVTCHYRVPLGQLTEQVGGLRSLLWSLRHTVTHNQAMPHTHAHTPMKKHVLVCTNNDCADKGALRVLRRLQRSLKDKKIFKDFKVTRTSCMGRCGEGPTVAVYPDGVWYREMDEVSAEHLVNQHLLKDKLVAQKVDNIMQ